ncbi:hypothetical protein GGTG_14069 [Gaeumannomyces tritici R3-111a-1]|uniref:Uncharacterized protein n=1 Tax=Gaeumannomyces tritici (strain R3-111a-1) TaxID=644352 RepID=J3PKK9_GAET3|nr:hypothetical protein GGTG_14069 [Gaeumannomyces tritici R3-111a-1]EJT68355.1 hypothetical protein GGTG_14069 [Gaeumannomyces tritici R3-111a-1]
MLFPELTWCWKKASPSACRRPSSLSMVCLGETLRQLVFGVLFLIVAPLLSLRLSWAILSEKAKSRVGLVLTD